MISSMTNLRRKKYSKRQRNCKGYFGTSPNPERKQNMITIIDGIPADTRVLDRMYPDAKTIGDIVDAFRHDYANDSFQEHSWFTNDITRSEVVLGAWAMWWGLGGSGYVEDRVTFNIRRDNR